MSKSDDFQFAASAINRFFQTKKRFFNLNSISLKAIDAGRCLLAQLWTYMTRYQFIKIIEKYKGNYKAQEFSYRQQYVCMVFTQLTYRISLQNTESCLKAFSNKFYHFGIRSKVFKSALAYWNQKQMEIPMVNMPSILLAMHGSCIKRQQIFSKAGWQCLCFRYYRDSSLPELVFVG